MTAGRGSADAFAPLDWGLLAAVALMWGASFLLIDVGLDGLHPASIAWLRVLFGAATIACIPAARGGVRRADRFPIALLGIVWMTVPFLLFPFAQQWIDSSLAGMINGAAPLFTAALAALWYARAPRGWQLAGLMIGFLGVLTIYFPSIDGARGTALGAGMVLLAAFLYGIAFNLAEPLENRNGALPVIWRAQLVALVLLSPPGLFGLAQSAPDWSNMLAMVALGALSTGVGFVAFVTLVGRVGAARGSVTIYFIPVIAIILGVAFRGDSVAPAAMFGTALVLLGAWLTSRRQSARPGTGAEAFANPDNRP